MGVFLRELERADIPVINRWRRDRDMVAQLGGVFRFAGPEVDDQWFDRYLGARHNNVRLAICDEEPARLIGVVYLLGIDWISRGAECAIWIGQKARQNQGVGRIAMRGLLDHAFKDLNLNRVHLTVLSANERAMALYRGLGFVQEGVLREAVFKNGRYLDLVQMALLSPQWK